VHPIPNGLKLLLAFCVAGLLSACTSADPSEPGPRVYGSSAYPNEYVNGVRVFRNHR